jgi:hypothetical protein
MKYQVTLSADKTSPSLAKKKLRQTTKRRYIQSLRLQPCAVFKISQRAVVYSTKAYELGLIDFALHALSERQEMNRIHQQILATTQELRDTGRVDDMQFRFSEVARMISVALLSVCQHAYEVSPRAAELSQHAVHKRSTNIVGMGEHVNRSMRLCTFRLCRRRGRERRRGITSCAGCSIEQSESLNA